MATSMKGAVGTADRVIRAVLGIALLVYAVFYAGAPEAADAAAAGGVSTLQVVLGIVGVVLLGTAAARFCPLYRVLGVCTA